MRESVESEPTRSARTAKDPVAFNVPPVTASPGSLSTGRASPVSIDSSISERPSTTTPSTGTFSPGRTITRSPATTWASGTVASTPPRTTHASGGVRFIKDSMAWFVAPFARDSRIFPSKTKVMSIAHVSKYGIPPLICTPASPVQSPAATGMNVIARENRNAMVVPSATSTSMFADPPLSEPYAPL